jgi:histidyl-tRNA synthetase
LLVNGVNVGGGGRYDKLVQMMGGIDAPAAGFALYIDRLAALINIDKLYVPVSQRVSIRINPGAMKLGNEVSELLRRAGVTVLTALRGRHAPDCGWELEVGVDTPPLVLLNCGTGEKNDCFDAMEAVILVGMS